MHPGGRRIYAGRLDVFGGFDQLPRNLRTSGLGFRAPNNGSGLVAIEKVELVTVNCASIPERAGAHACSQKAKTLQCHHLLAPTLRATAFDAESNKATAGLIIGNGRSTHRLRLSEQSLGSVVH